MKRTVGIAAIVYVHLWLGATAGATAALPAALCELAQREGRLELEEAELALDVARAEFAAFEQIFGLIEGLWKSDAIERMVWLEAKYDRDAAALGLKRAELLIDRQTALVDHYGVVCEGLGSDEAARTKAIRDARERYARAHCAILAKDVEIARTNLVFRREKLASTLDLREGRVATRQAVILAELDVEREERRLAHAERRRAACTSDPDPGAEATPGS